MSLFKKKSPFSDKIIVSRTSFAQHTRQKAFAAWSIKFPWRHSTIVNPLLNIPIGRRLTLGFLIPALIAAIILGSVGSENQQRLMQEATFCRALLNAYTSLTEEADAMQLMQTDLSRAATYAALPHPKVSILEEDQITIQALETQVNPTFVTYYKQDLIKDSPELVALFTEAGHGIQIENQFVYSEGILQSWQAYRSIQEQALTLIQVESTQTQAASMLIPGHLTPAQIL